jgi:Tol biopolymer transport system component
MDLYYVDTNGKILSRIDMTTSHNLSGPAYEYSGVSFSPDGKTIAYNAVEAMEPPFNRFRVHLMNRDGTNDRAIPAPLETHYSQAWPVFSPDGKTIAMESWETGTDGTPETRISRLAVAAADGSAVARWIGPSQKGQTFVKTWSPDGTYILLGMRERQAVFVLDPDTGEGDRLPWAIDLPDVQRVVSK